mgnify:CR=1 FL=1
MPLSLLPDDIAARAARVVAENAATGRKVVTAESCTGGLIAGALTSVPGSSTVVYGGYVTYSDDAKRQMLGVTPQYLRDYGAAFANLPYGTMVATSDLKVVFANRAFEKLFSFAPNSLRGCPLANVMDVTNITILIDAALRAELMRDARDAIGALHLLRPDALTPEQLSTLDALAWQLEQLPGVESTNSMAALSKLAMVGYNEGHLKWFELLPNESALGGVQTRAPRELFNQSCSFLALYVYLKDHKAETLERVVAEVERFKAQNDSPELTFKLAAGSAGIDAATNIVVRQAMREMLLWVYAAVVILCWITFRSWRAVVVAVLPLMLTSILCEALMVGLGMGVKVATLPVIALGVGIGVDYALYVLSVTLARLRAGDSLADAYAHALQFTGRVVMLTGVTLALAVGTWAFSPIKFQADMGILLAFMFVWNMVGALVLLPALAHFLLPAARTVQAENAPSTAPHTASVQGA